MVFFTESLIAVMFQPRVMCLTPCYTFWCFSLRKDSLSGEFFYG